MALAEATASLTSAAMRASAAVRHGVVVPEQPTPATDPIQAAAAEALSLAQADAQGETGWRAAAASLGAAAAVERLAALAVTTGLARPVEPGPAAPAAPATLAPADRYFVGPGRIPTLGVRPAVPMPSREPATVVEEWGRSRGDLRGDVHASGIETFGEEQQEAIRAYFRRLSEDR
jgi:hypothetical protein